MGHHAEHVAAFVDDARDVVQRAVRVGAGYDAAAGKAAAQDDTVAAVDVGVLVPQVLELRADDLVDNPTAVAVRRRAWKNNHGKLHEWPDLELCRRFAASAAGAKEPTST